MKSNQRRCALGAAFALAVVLALSSAAFACTVWQGKLTVWGVSAGSSGQVSAVGSGANNMTYCNNSDPSGQANIGSAGSATRQIKLSVGSGGACGDLQGGKYFVNYLPDKSSDCMSGLRMGEFTMTGGTTPAGGVGPFTIPGLGSDPYSGILSTSVGGWADICIDDERTIFGNQVPIFLL